MNIAITGASGFIGSNLSSFLTNNDDINLISIVRKVTNKVDEYTFTDFFKGNIKANIDCFIHLASPNYDYCEDNSLQEGIVSLTENILKALPQYQCSNFIFFSSCKVYGESSIKNTNFTESSNLNPVSDYAKAKVDAELLVKKISDEVGLNFLIYRLPFVYGKGMKSNIGKLLKILDKSLPILSFKNGAGLKKSFLSVENIQRAIDYNLYNTSSIDNNVYNLTDLYSISLDNFLTHYKNLSKSKSLIIRLHKYFFFMFVKIPIIKNIFIKVFGSLVIENSKIQKKTSINFLPTSHCVANLVGKI
tara:strand:- start:452 stop:1363 length:912 start_codon:yes stop_codon:yes gene_type:complete